MTQLSPEALAGLVERLNTEMAWPQQAMGVDVLAIPHPLCREAAAAILALEAQVETLEKAVINMTDCWTTAGKRATRAEAMLREADAWLVATLNMVEGNGCPPRWDGIRAFRTTLARSLTAPVEKEKE